MTDADSGSAVAGSHRDWIELASTILMAMAAILTAWTGFQAAKWGGVQATSFSQAGAARTESTRFSALADEQRSYDAVSYLNWSNVVFADLRAGDIPDPTEVGGYEPTPGTLSGFQFERFRPEFQPCIEEWVALQPFVTPDAPPSPIQMDCYTLEAEATAADFLHDAEVSASNAGKANQNGDNYVVLTILAALVLFFAALASKLERRRNQLIALGLAAVFFVATMSTVATLPIEI